jgi:hypothetical protein
MLEKHRADSLSDIFESVRKIRIAWNPARDNEEIWFRGAPAGYSLVPSLYRPTEQNCDYDEVAMFESFKALGSPLAPRSVVTEWDWYFLARHHGMPTRLLDWSSSILPALFFALEPHVRNKTRAQIDHQASERRKARFNKNSPVLWIMEATTLNKWSVNDASVIAIRDELNSFLPDEVGQKSGDSKWSNENPIAIYPRHTNTRLVAQAGRFTVHGALKTPLEKIAAKNGDVRLAQIQLSVGSIARLWDELDTGGVTPATLLQDLDSLVKYLKYCYDGSK